MSAPPASGWRAWYARPGVEVPLVYLGTLIGIRLVVQLVHHLVETHRAEGTRWRHRAQ